MLHVSQNITILSDSGGKPIWVVSATQIKPDLIHAHLPWLPIEDVNFARNFLHHEDAQLYCFHVLGDDISGILDTEFSRAIIPQRRSVSAIRMPKHSPDSIINAYRYSDGSLNVLGILADPKTTDLFKFS